VNGQAPVCQELKPAQSAGGLPATSY